MSSSGGFASLLFDQGVPKNSQRHLADWNAICILHWSDCVWLCCLLSQFLLFGDQKHCVFRPITWYDKSRTTESIPGLYYWDRLLLWSQLRTGLVQFSWPWLPWVSDNFHERKKNKRAEIEPFDFWVIPKIVLQNIHKLAVIFSLKGNDLIFNSVVRIWLVIGVKNTQWSFG